MGARKGKTELFAINVKTHKEVWSVVINEKPFNFKGNSWGIGPRATPTVSEGMVYAITGWGEMVCVDAVGAGTGEVVITMMGSSARSAPQMSGVPTDAVVVGILDSLSSDGQAMDLDTINDEGAH